MKKLVAIGCLLALSGAIPGSGAQGQRQNPAAAAVPGEIIVQYHANASVIDQIDARSLVSGAHKQLLRDAGDGVLELVAIPSEAVAGAIAVLQRHPAVRFAEPNYIVTHTTVPNDPRYLDGSLYGVYSEHSPPGPAETTNVFGSAAETVWAAGHDGSNSVHVLVIDTGVCPHVDLNANRFVNPFETAGNGIDDDGNGFIDDINGWDFVRDDNTVCDADEHFHGTHVAGTIGAVGNNGIGVVGVNQKVTMVSLKFLGPTGNGTLANAVRALDYGTDFKTRHGTKIVASNNSWGCPGCFTQSLEDAIKRGANAGINFVAAAGNSNNDNDSSPFYPANHTTLGPGGPGVELVTSVVAIDAFGNKASFSNFGKETTDLGASGVSILSTVPGGGYGTASGTSMASPHVAGALALYASYDGRPFNVAAADARRMDILNNAALTPSLVGLTKTDGRLDLEPLAGGIPPPPSPLDDILFTSPVIGCKTLTGKVTLNNPAPPGGQVVNLTSANPAATVPAQVTVAEGKLAKKFTIVTTAVAADTTGDITASIGTDTASRSLTVQPIGMKKLTLSQTSIKGGNSLTATAKLACAAGPGPITATLSSNKPNVANPAVSNLVFNVGEKSKTFTINTFAVSSSKNVIISATANGKTKTATLTVNP
jgi:subtilisin family serine protease